MHWTFYDFVGTKSNLLVLGIKCSGMAVSWQNFKNFTPSKAIVLLVWCLTLIYKTKTSYSKESASKKKILLTSTNALDKIVLHYSFKIFSSSKQDMWWEQVSCIILGFFSIYYIY